MKINDSLCGSLCLDPVMIKTKITYGMYLKRKVGFCDLAQRGFNL